MHLFHMCFYQSVWWSKLCLDQKSNEMDSPLLQANKALGSHHSKSMESHPSLVQQWHMNLATPHLPPP